MSNRHILMEANKTLSEGHYEQFIHYCSEDMKWKNVGESTFNGKEEILGYISSAYDGLTFKTENYIEDKDFVVETGQIVFEKNGGSVKSSFCDVWNFKDGVIRQVTSFVI